ncbi:putative F-box/FBD/LRR-repeat protein At1g78760 [Cajanus cajan]|uniref:putative F-box/FBD/LRR-repeat protein At1g78760 n=1 Tax=Cajanus cajan TaxID=3821 RepID=UPI00098DB32C|nr:putative F-box/FBD/LRR-repeat protein At1g78760 [Cajanus cajan]
MIGESSESPDHKDHASMGEVRNSEDCRDRLSELPDCVLLHIMKFLDTKHAVRTNVLSKQWNNVWKCLTSLSFRHSHFNTVTNYNKFVSWVLSNRDGSISLHDLSFMASGSTAPKLMTNVMEHVMLHNILHLTIYIHLNNSRVIEHYSVPSVFSCPSLTFLRLCINSYDHALELPKSLHLPALKTLYLTNVNFTAQDNDCAEPFSTCNMLSRLVLKGCSLGNDAKVLCISNSSLSSLKLKIFGEEKYEIALSTPNLTSLTVTSCLSSHRLSFMCNLSFLEEVKIDISFGMYYSVIVSWLQLLTNVKILTLSSYILQMMLKILSNLATMKNQPPCFARLETLKVKIEPGRKIDEEELNRIVEYLRPVWVWHV